MKDYFIGQGTWIAVQFDTLEEMLAYHKAMPELERHFCSLIPGSVPESVLKGDSVYENLRFTLRCAIDGQQEDSPVTFDLIRKATENPAWAETVCCCTAQSAISGTTPATATIS